MSRILWGSSGTRRHEDGVDRGVFYPNDGPGIPWNGLVRVLEDPEMELKPTFVDGVPYRSQKTRTNFAATLEAFTCPLEFEDYDGSYGRQRRKAFGLSYRTRVGNDISADYASLIHIVYNAMAMPTDVDSSTIGQDSPDATLLSWVLSTTPIEIPGAKPAAHLIIDTSIAHPEAIQAIEDVLYGSSTSEAHLPTPTELLELFEQHAIFAVIDHGDGTWTATGPDEAIQVFPDDTFQINWPSAIFLDSDTYQLSSL